MKVKMSSEENQFKESNGNYAKLEKVEKKFVCGTQRSCLEQLLVAVEA
jgi:hypothetical protein